MPTAPMISASLGTILLESSAAAAHAVTEQNRSGKTDTANAVQSITAKRRVVVMVETPCGAAAISRTIAHAAVSIIQTHRDRALRPCRCDAARQQWIFATGAVFLHKAAMAVRGRM